MSKLYKSVYLQYVYNDVYPGVHSRTASTEYLLRLSPEVYAHLSDMHTVFVRHGKIIVGGWAIMQRCGSLGKTLLTLSTRMCSIF